MVEALIADLADVPGWRVVTTWDARLEPPRFRGRQIDYRLVASPDEERDAFREFAGRCDGTFVIAPEFQGILLARYRLVQEAGGRWLGCSPEAIALCSDKLRLAAHLHACGVRAIPTCPLPIDSRGRAQLPQPAAASGSFEYPLVIKPRDGAGSQQTRLVATEGEFQQACREFAAPEVRNTAIVQPFVPGRAVSVVALLPALPLTTHHSPGPHVFPVAEQRLSDDGRFQYLGGRVRCPPPHPEQSAIEAVVHETCRTVPGLAGYVGFDMILPEDNPDVPVLVEINPRLTTSYLGYRRLCRALAARIVAGPDPGPLEWAHGDVCFCADGTAG